MWNPIDLLSRLLALLERHKSAALLGAAVLFALTLYTGGSAARFTPVRRVLDLGLGTLHTGISSAMAVLNVWVWKENSDLRNALMEERLDRLRFDEALRENERFRAMLGFLPPPSFVPLPCLIIAASPEPLGGSITVNRGTSSGLRGGEAVVSLEGLVGHVSELHGNRSLIKLVTNYDSPVAVRVERNRVLGVLEWDPATARLHMRNVPATEEVVPGDSLISSGFGGIYPEGLFVGTVESVRPDPMGLVQEIRVSPGARFNRLEELFILRPKSPFAP